MKSYTLKLSSDARGCCETDESQSCNLQGITLTSFSKTPNPNNYEDGKALPESSLEGVSKDNDPLRNDAAIVCQNVTKGYSKREVILSDLNMRVPSGSVYALLGSSGCGKTSLISCILGIFKVDNGRILVYGENAGQNNIGIPGRNVGFMPQQISLYPEFTILETFKYFASFSGLSKNKCVENVKFFTQLLKLPPLKRKVGTLSGGQQRRVSFAAALIHDPPLLILDEPTVGIDPIVHQTMWTYIEELALIKKTTVIITTHYIEEARKANIIGVMRNGKILVEQPPQQLIDNTNLSSLEKAVLKLFKSGLQSQVSCGGNTSSDTNNTCVELGSPNMNPNHETRSYRMATVKMTEAGRLQQSAIRIKALTYKNFIVMIRNILLLSFVIWIPAVEVFTVDITYDFNPKSLKVGIINQEANTSICDNISTQVNCSFEYLSCKYLATVNPDMVEFVHFDFAEDAEAAVHSGWLRGYLEFPPTISQNLFALATSGESLNDNSSIVIGRFDETNKAISIALKVTLFNALDELMSTLLTSCDLDSRIGKSSLQYGSPVYGNSNMDFREYTCPSVAIVATFFFPIIVIGIRLIEERNCGMLERSIVAGVQTWEIFVSYLLSEFWILIVQGVLVFIVTTLVAGISIAGSVSLALALLVLTGFSGSSFGILLGYVCREKIDVGILALATFLPNLVLSGICWPLEGMPQPLRYIAYILPCTLPAESMRSIVLRGFEFSDERVWLGFAVIICHILLYFTLTALHKTFKAK